MKKIQTLKGFRDFLPKEMVKRAFVEGKIHETFVNFGFEEIKTPTLEYAEVILGKYGKEADKLVYAFTDRGGRRVALPYDLTVPTARVLAENKGKFPQYFRRFQIQNVFRADKPQKGRFREFTQCDIDIFGSTSPIADAEILASSYFAFKNIGFKNPKLIINDREVLFDILKRFKNKKISTLSIIQTIDKLDKISESMVVEELAIKGLSQANAKAALQILKNANPTKNLVEIFTLLKEYGIPEEDYVFNPFIARGLDYYTNMIFEVRLSDYNAGSVAGGGRYDKLIKQLSGIAIPAVGMAIGFDRTVEAATRLKLITGLQDSKKVLVTVFEKNLTLQSIKVASLLRKSGIKTELYPNETVRLDKQLKYANQSGFNFVVIVGPEEAKESKVVLKNMKTGKQETLKMTNLKHQITNNT